MSWLNSRLLSTPRMPPVLLCLLVAIGYALAGRLGLLLAVPPGYATAIFPPAGIAMAAALIGGRRTLPWIFAGACALNLWVGMQVGPPPAILIALAIWIAAASTAQATLGAWLLRRAIGYPMALDNARDLGRFFLIAPSVCMVSPTASLAGMAAMGTVRTPQLAANWFSWWIGDTLGVLMFLPLVMVLAGEPRRFWRSRARPVALPMLLFFVLFVAIFMRTRAWEHDQALTEFRLLSQDFKDRLQFELAAQAESLQQLSASWGGPAPVTRAGFATLVSPLLQRAPVIQAIEWAPRVTLADRPAFEQAQQQQIPGFAIRDHDAHGAMVNAAPQHAYYPVLYMEPLHGNQAALGYDLASDRVRDAAIRAARRNHGITTTAPIRLVQDPGDPTGMLLTLAVSNGANGPGVLVAVLRMDRFIADLLGTTGRAIEARIVDANSQRVLFDSLPAGLVPIEQQIIGFAGRNYRIGTAPTAAYDARHQTWQSWMVLVIGVLSTSLLGALLMLSTGERQRFARLLAERTRERDRIWQVSEDLLGIGNFDGHFVSVNPAWTRTLGWSEDEIRAIHVNDLRHPDDLPIGAEGRRRLAEGAGTVRMENRFRHKDGTFRWIYWTMTAQNGLIYMIGRNVTADRDAARLHQETEDQLRQLQKTEAIGHLTGGIAHDFNNLLTIIIGNLEILGHTLTNAPARARRAVDSAMGGATRAATLTQRLLAYAQRQPLQPRIVDLNELVSGMGELISRTRGENIACEFATAKPLPPCFCDANQLETALLNLVINARDAMPEGGRLRIETGSIQFDQPAAAARSISAGHYLVLSVGDTGIGMTPATLARAFEPFFTTKETGKGTGLGLSMVYGFVKQSNGHIEIDSTLGRGTTVRIFLPALASAAAPADPTVNSRPATDPPRPGTGETILLVEDDTGVRGFVLETLHKHGYRVVAAPDAAAALAIIGDAATPIDLLLTDVIMPAMDGRELANRARALLPRLPVLFMSGYAQHAVIQQGRLDPDIALIEKPFRGDALAARVRAVLDAARRVADDGTGDARQPSDADATW